MTQASRAELSSCHLVKVSWRGCQALTLGGGKEDRKGERERERERERSVSPERVPKGGRPQPGSPSVENAQLVSQASPC
jgi:hypothetical protein